MVVFISASLCQFWRRVVAFWHSLTVVAFVAQYKLNLAAGEGQGDGGGAFGMRTLHLGPMNILIMSSSEPGCKLPEEP